MSRAGVGPEPCAVASLTAEGVAEKFRFMLRAETQERAQEMSRQINSEDGKCCSIAVLCMSVAFFKRIIDCHPRQV